MYPLKLTGVTRSPLWSGDRLLKEWNKKSECDRIGESWELTVRKDGMSEVANGDFCGIKLSELLKTHGAAIMGRSACSDGFPLLIKFIDAGDNLSVQVHPDDAYAARVENDRGKTEMWYIVDAKEGAEIICGLKEGETVETLRAAIERGEAESVLCHVPVSPGESYFIPAGLPHAIGEGILIAEIQQNCDLTYRLWDYLRHDGNGNTRELHVDKALDVIRSFTREEIEELRCPDPTLRARGELLADCAYFRVEKIEGTDEARPLSTDGKMGHLLCVEGEGELLFGGVSYPILRGEGCLLPASLDSVSLRGDGVFLFTVAK